MLFYRTKGAIKIIRASVDENHFYLDNFTMISLSGRRSPALGRYLGECTTQHKRHRHCEESLKRFIFIFGGQLSL